MSQEAIQDNVSTPRVVVKRTRAKRVRAQGFEGIEGLNRICKSIALAALLAVIGIGAFSRFYVAKFSYLPAIETVAALEQGDIANQLRNGRGFTTRIGHPMALDKKVGEDRWYDVTYNPVYPLLLSAFFRVRGSADSSIALFNGLIHFVTGLFVYLITAKLRGPRTAVVAVVLYYGSIEAISAALNGVGVSVAAFLITVGVWGILKCRESGTETARMSPASSYGWPALVGIAFGLSYLVGGLTVLVILPAAALLAKSQANARRKWLVVVAAFTITLAPWVARNLVVSQAVSPMLSQYKLLTWTTTYPGQSVYQELPGEVQEPIRFVFTHPGEMARKFVRGVTSLYRSAPSFLNPYFFPMVLLFGLLGATTVSDMARRVWVTLLLMLGLQLITAAFYDFDSQYLAAFTPLGICLGAIAMTALVTEHIHQPVGRIAVILGVIVVASFPYGATLLQGGEMPPTYSMPNLSHLKMALTDDALVTTDIPAAVAWYSNKSAVPLPPQIQDIEVLAKRGGADPDYVYLSCYMSKAVGTEWFEAFYAYRGLDPNKALILGQPIVCVDPQRREAWFQRHKKLSDGFNLAPVEASDGKGTSQDKAVSKSE